jgi:hypothetical protein
MPKFSEFEISDFRGIATSNRHPQKNECQECKNFDTRYVDGDLTLRAGFTQKYPFIAKADHRSKLMVTLTGTIDPAASVNVVGVGTLFTTELAIGDSILVSGEERIVGTITDNTHLTVTVAFSNNGNDTAPKKIGVSSLEFESFYVPNDGGQEIKVWVTKATLTAETGIDNATPATRNILALFSSHQFNGTAWVAKNWDRVTTGKYWLNHTIVTTVHTGGSSASAVDLDCMGTILLTGSIDTAASVDVVGVGTLFTTELVIGDRILVLNKGEIGINGAPGIFTEGKKMPPSPREMAKGGKVGSASKRADGIATKGKTRGTMITMKGGGYAC